MVRTFTNFFVVLPIIKQTSGSRVKKFRESKYKIAFFNRTIYKVICEFVD